MTDNPAPPAAVRRRRRHNHNHRHRASSMLLSSLFALLPHPTTVHHVANDGCAAWVASRRTFASGLVANNVVPISHRGGVGRSRLSTLIAPTWVHGGGRRGYESRVMMLLDSTRPDDATTAIATIESPPPLPTTSDDAMPSDDSTTTTTITTEDSGSTSSSSSGRDGEYATTSASPRKKTTNQPQRRDDGGGVWLPPSMRYNPGTRIFSIRQPQDLLDFVIEDERLSVGE